MPENGSIDPEDVDAEIQSDPSEHPPIPDHGTGVEEIWWDEADEHWHGSDEYGEFRLDGGAQTPSVEGVDVNYIPCNGTLKHWETRYGEKRYCKKMSLQQFYGRDEGSTFCNTHQHYENTMKEHENALKSGAFVKSYEHIFQYLPAHKKVLAIEFLRGLLEESTYDFDVEEVEWEMEVGDDATLVDTEGGELDAELESVTTDFPVPQDNVMQAQALWYASIMFIQLQGMHEEQFRVAAEETHEGRSLAPGERVSVVSVTDDGQVIEDTEEHHLNLPISRIMGNYKEHLKFGGVEEDDSTDVTVEARDWVAQLDQPEPEPASAAGQGNDSPMLDLDIPEQQDSSDGDDE